MPKCTFFVVFDSFLIFSVIPKRVIPLQNQVKTNPETLPSLTEATERKRDCQVSFIIQKKKKHRSVRGRDVLPCLTLSDSNIGLAQHLLLGVGREPLVERRLGDARRHPVGDELRRDGADGVLGGRRGAEEARGRGLGREDGGRGDLVDLCAGDDAVAVADLGGEDLLEALLRGDLFDALEVLRGIVSV